MPIHVYMALVRLAELGRRIGDGVGWSRFVESIRRGYEKVRDIVEGNTRDSDGDEGAFGGADPSAGGAQDSPNPADQTQGHGHVGPPVGSGSYHYDDVPVLPESPSPNPPPQDESDSSQTPPSNGWPNTPPPSVLNPPPSQDDSDSGDDAPDDNRLDGFDLDATSANPADQESGYLSPMGDRRPSGNDGGTGEGGDGGDGGGGGKPVFLDLDGDGVELVSLEDSTAFYDIHGDGFRYNLSWVAPDDGILAYDRDGDGQISDREEIAFVDYVEGARTDLEGLRHFDTNGDDQLTAADGEWSKFRVWQDLDGDGVSDPGELRTLDAAGVRSISLQSTGGVETHADGTRVLGRGTYTTGSVGSPVTRELLDVSLAVAPWGVRGTADGVEIRWTEDDVTTDAFIAGSNAAVTLDVASTGHRMAVGGAGADRFSNTGAHDVLLAGGGGDDVLRGGTGDDWLLGGAGRDELHGGAGDDVLAAGSNATGGWQVLSGESGSDTYRIGSTDGQVRIDSAAEGARTGGADRVVFTDLALSEVEFTHHGSPAAGAATPVEGVALVVRWTKDAVSGEVHIAEMGRHIERYEFADGSVLGGVEADWLARYDPTNYPGDTQDRLVGTAHDDTIVSGSFADRLDGMDGNDHLDGGAGRDALYGGWGDDTLTGGEGNDALTGGAGDDELYGGAGDDELRGGAGDDVLVGGAGVDPLLQGDEGDDTLDAGASDGSGRQRLDGGAGNDTYRVGKGDGVVVVVSWAEGADTGTADRVVFTDLALADVSFVMETWRFPRLTEDGEPMWTSDGELIWEDEHTLVVEWTKDGESGRLEVADGGEHIERFEFADGSVLSRIEAQRLVGTSGADLIASGAGDERIDGGGGDDTLSGGGGDDTYEFSGRAFGSDRVSDVGGDDRIAFTSDVGWDQLWFSRTGDDLLIELMGTDSEVTVEGWWSGPLVSDVDAARQVETIEAGEYALAASAVQQLVQAMAGMAGPASGQTTLSAVQRAQMAAPLAAWQELTGS